jgi:glutathione synthase/RimK-type ligase-like ATP-grasp enzyme
MRESAAGHALVLKPLFGSQGRGLQRVGWFDGSHHALPPLGVEHGSLAYLQRYVHATASPGYDWRVLVVGGRARTAMRRVSEHWVHNVAQGARCEAAPLTVELAALAEAAAAALELDYAGVDLMPAAEGAPIQVIEVNGVAAWQGLQRVTPFNIAAILAADLIDRKLAAATGAERRA